jgi:hypothetical protein
VLLFFGVAGFGAAIFLMEPDRTKIETPIILPPRHEAAEPVKPKFTQFLAGWYGFENSPNKDRESELRARCSPNFTRINVPSGTHFNALCESIGKKCVRVCDWEGSTKSCSESPYAYGTALV